MVKVKVFRRPELVGHGVTVGKGEVVAESRSRGTAHRRDSTRTFNRFKTLAYHLCAAGNDGEYS